MAKWDYDGPILDIENLSISFFTRRLEIPAVMDFSCKVMPGEAMGLVGESGCGKSTVALAVMRDLGKNGRIVGGTIKFKGRDLTTMSDEELDYIFSLTDKEEYQGYVSENTAPDIMKKAILSHLDQMKKERPEVAKKIEQHWTATDTQSLLKGGLDREKGK